MVVIRFALLFMIVAVGIVTAVSLPDLKRYIHIRSM